MSGTLAALAIQLTLGGAIHLPPWSLSADGELVALEPSARLQIEGGRAEPVGAGVWRVVPASDRRRVRLRSGETVVDHEVTPPPGRIAIEVVPTSLRKGRDRSAELSLVVLDASGNPDPRAMEPVIACSTGTIRQVSATGPGRFKARFALPTSRHPEVAVLTAIVPRCPQCATPQAVGAAVLPLESAIELPGHTEPHVQVKVTIGDRAFGPVTADERGDFKVPVVVAPGQRLGRGVSIDKLGNRVERTIDLQLPPVNQLACTAWPRKVPANGNATAQIWCVATDAAGHRLSQARLELSGQRGRVTRLERVGEALFRARYVAPRGGGGKTDRLVATFPAGGATSRQELILSLATGAPVDVGYAFEREPIPLASSVPVRTWAVDDRGDALAPPAGPSGAEIGFVAPDRFVARADAGNWLQPAELRSELPVAEEAAFLWLWREGDQWIAAARSVDMCPVAGLTLRFGSGAVAKTDQRGEARVQVKEKTETVEADYGLRAAGWTGVNHRPPPMAKSRIFDVPLGPTTPADVRASVDGGVLRWKVHDQSGRVVPGRQVRLQTGAVKLGPIELDGEGGRCRVKGHGPVAVVDVETGVAAVVEVP